MSGRVEKCYRVAVAVLLGLVLANAAGAGLRTVSDFDMGWHLATGRWVIQHHAIPSTDVLSYTVAGTPWIYPPFAGVLLYLVYSVGGYAGLSVFCALACIATVAYLTRRRDVASLALAMCAIEPIAFRTGPRADLFNTVFMAVFLGELWAYQRGRSNRLWVLPLVMLLWVNLHPGFILGLAVIGAYLLLEGSELLFAERRSEAFQRLRKAWPWLAGCVGVTLLNPWGVHLYSASLALSGMRGKPQGAYNSAASIAEFLPVPISSHLLTQLVDLRHPENGFTWLMVIAILVILLALWRRQPGPALIQAGAFYICLQHSRYIGLFCITTAILGSTLLSEACSTGPQAEHSHARSRRNGPLFCVPPVLALVFVFIVGAITLLHTVDFVSNRTHVVFNTQSRFGLGEAAWYPERAASFIRRERLPGNIFEEYGLGGFAAWRLGPEYPDFIDGRFYPFVPAVLDEERKLRSLTPDSSDWQTAADQWGINTLLILESGSRAATRQDALPFCQSTNWSPVYMDETALVLLRNTPANRRWIDRLQIDCSTQQLAPPPSASRKDLYDFWSNAGGLLLALQRYQESETALAKAAALYPYDPNVRMTLAQYYVHQQRLDKAEAEYREILALNESDAPWQELGRIYAADHRLPEAEQAFSRAAHLAAVPCIPYMDLAQVELWLNHPEAALRAYDAAEASSPYRRGTEGLAPGLYADIAGGRADANRMLAQLPQAIKFEEEAVRLNPGVAGRWNDLADMLQATGQIDLSRQARQRSFELQAGH